MKISEWLMDVINYIQAKNIWTHALGSAFLIVALVVILRNMGQLATNSANIWITAGGLATVGAGLIVAAHASTS